MTTKLESLVDREWFIPHRRNLPIPLAYFHAYPLSHLLSFLRLLSQRDESKEMISSGRRWLGALTAAATMWPVTARAQEVARSFEELAGIAIAEETVVVTDANGRRFRGVLTTITEDSLSLGMDGRTATFARSDVTAVRAVDGIANGVVIGAGAGLGAALGTLGIAGSGEGYVLPSAKAAVPLVLSGIGALVGGLIDRAREGRTLYISPARRSGVVISPLGADRQGVLVSVRF